MRFIKVEGTAELTGDLRDVLNNVLESKKPVLWLVPGGSNIKTAIEVMSMVDDENLSNLTVMLTDERFGPPGHKDSNFFQLHEGGFDARGAKFKDILSYGGLKDVKRAYNDEAIRNFNNADAIVGFFGMGPDGHIAGILPHSPASTAGKIWVESYETDPFNRVTLTPFALSHIQTAYVGAFGEEKLEALTNLRDRMLPITEQPAQILCHIPEVLIYNDQIEG